MKPNLYDCGTWSIKQAGMIPLHGFPCSCGKPPTRESLLLEKASLETTFWSVAVAIYIPVSMAVLVVWDQ